MNHGKIRFVLRSKGLLASIVLILSLGSAIYCTNTLSVENNTTSAELQHSTLSLLPTRSLKSQEPAIHKGNHYLVRQQRWIF